MKINFDYFDFEKITVDELPVHFKKLPWASGWLEMRVFLHAGAYQDPINKEGLAHFFEHLPFDGTVKYPSFKILDDLSRQIFMNSLNAFTAFTCTVFTGKTAHTKLEKAVDILRELTFFPLLDEKEIEKERKIITQELWGRFHNEKREALLKRVNQNFYGNHVRSREFSPIGWSKTIQDITKEDLLEFKKEHYHKSNMELIIVGDVDPKIAESVAKQLISDIGSGKKVEKMKQIENAPLPKEKTIEISYKEYFGANEEASPKQTNITLSRMLPSPKNRYTGVILKRMIREILFEKLRGNLGSIYTPQVYWTKTSDHSELEIDVNVDPKEEKTALKLINETLTEIGNTEDIHQKLFMESKDSLIESMVLSEYTASSIADYAIDDIAIFEPIRTMGRDIDNVTKNTYKDVSMITEEELLPSKQFYYIERP